MSTFVVGLNTGMSPLADQDYHKCTGPFEMFHKQYFLCRLGAGNTVFLINHCIPRTVFDRFITTPDWIGSLPIIN